MKCAGSTRYASSRSWIAAPKHSKRRAPPSMIQNVQSRRVMTTCGCERSSRSSTSVASVQTPASVARRAAASALARRFIRIARSATCRSGSVRSGHVSRNRRRHVVAPSACSKGLNASLFASPSICRDVHASSEHPAGRGNVRTSSTRTHAASLRAAELPSLAMTSSFFAFTNDASPLAKPARHASASAGTSGSSQNRASGVIEASGAGAARMSSDTVSTGPVFARTTLSVHAAPGRAPRRGIVKGAPRLTTTRKTVPRASSRPSNAIVSFSRRSSGSGRPSSGLPRPWAIACDNNCCGLNGNCDASIASSSPSGVARSPLLNETATNAFPRRRRPYVAWSTTNGAAPGATSARAASATTCRMAHRAGYAPRRQSSRVANRRRSTRSRPSVGSDDTHVTAVRDTSSRRRSAASASSASPRVARTTSVASDDPSVSPSNG
mmetsp:Transcript_8075/g.25356  ORF Transcript_8075/g.25356 Transcript_8075/m.25356 type:complete len:439 (-) Transcript_8075:550-1866(-)